MPRHFSSTAGKKIQVQRMLPTLAILLVPVLVHAMEQRKLTKPWQLQQARPLEANTFTTVERQPKRWRRAWQPRRIPLLPPSCWCHRSRLDTKAWASTL